MTLLTGTSLDYLHCEDPVWEAGDGTKEAGDRSQIKILRVPRNKRGSSLR